MRVSRDFLKDFAYIANLYEWSAADIEDAKAQTRVNPAPMREYWTELAAAHRAGYQQAEANGYERLRVWADRNPAFSDKYARTREGISAGIAHACEGAGTLSDHYAHAHEGRA